MRINIRHIFVIAMGSLESSIQKINDIYMEKESYYYDLYIHSGMYNDLMKTILPMELEENTNKLIGIVEACYKENSFLKIEEIIKSFNPSIIRYVKNSHDVDISKFQAKYLDDKLQDIEESVLFANLVALIYLSKIKNKDIKINATTNQFIFGTWDRYNAILNKSFNTICLEQTKLEYNDKIQKYYSLFNLKPDEKIQKQSIGLFLENIIEDGVLANFSKEAIDNRAIDINEYYYIRDNLFKKGIYKYIGCYSRFINSLGMNDNLIFSSVNIDNDVLEAIFRDFVYSKEGNDLHEDESSLYIISCLVLYNFVELYKKAKDVYLNRSKDERYKELVKYETNLQDKEHKIDTIIFENKKIINSKDDEIRKLKEKIKFMQEEKSELLEINKNLKKENLELNSELIDLNSKETEKEMDDIILKSEITLEEAINNLYDKKIAIFGGANNIKNIKNYLPNVTLYNDLNRDISSIKKADLIVLNSNFFNHSFTKKLDSYINKYNNTYEYIAGTNMERIIFTLNHYIMKK